MDDIAKLSAPAALLGPPSAGVGEAAAGVGEAAAGVGEAAGAAGGQPSSSACFARRLGASVTTLNGHGLSVSTV